MPGLLSVSFVISVRSENGMGGTENFARRHGVHRGFFKLWLLSSLCPLRSPREAELCTEVFQRFFCSPSVSSVISVRSENAVGGTMSFAQRHRGHRGFLKLWLLPSPCPLRFPGEAELCTEVFQCFFCSPLRVLCDLREI